MLEINEIVYARRRLQNPILERMGFTKANCTSHAITVRSRHWLGIKIKCLKNLSFVDKAEKRFRIIDYCKEARQFDSAQQNIFNYQQSLNASENCSRLLAMKTCN